MQLGISIISSLQEPSLLFYLGQKSIQKENKKRVKTSNKRDLYNHEIKPEWNLNFMFWTEAHWRQTVEKSHNSTSALWKCISEHTGKKLRQPFR